jgi:hypothetical protein
MKLISHLDPSQLRLGYLNCLTLVAGRQLDTRKGLAERLRRFLFQIIEDSDPRWQEFMHRADLTQLDRLKPEADPHLAEVRELFRISQTAPTSYPLHVLWLAQRGLLSHLGCLAEKNVLHILEMGRSFELLTTGYALSEKGVFLQNYLRHVLPGVEDGQPAANPFDLEAYPILRWFILYLLLSVDCVTPFLLQEFGKTSDGDLPNAPKLLEKAAVRLFEVMERACDITNVLDLRECRTFAERLQQKGVLKNQAQPRYHHLLEMQLLGRDTTSKKATPYVATEAGRRAAEVLAPLCERPHDQQDLLDHNFCRWTGIIYGNPVRPCEDDRRQLLYFARGFPWLQREIGFTPGRTVALAGCLLALADGWLVEVADMFALLRRVASGRWRAYLEYSGGSRLDQEFLIKVKPTLPAALEAELGSDVSG